MSSSIKLILEDLFSLQRLGIKVGLEHTEELLDIIGNPHLGLNCIHIAGTNGKGSTCAIINKILMESGLTVGLYTSPRGECAVTGGGFPQGSYGAETLHGNHIEPGYAYGEAINTGGATTSGTLVLRKFGKIFADTIASDLFIID
mgnify:CR=1 FL=1